MAFDRNAGLDFGAMRLVYTKGMRAALRLLRDDPRLEPRSKLVVEDHHDLCDATVLNLEETQETADAVGFGETYDDAAERIDCHRGDDAELLARECAMYGIEPPSLRALLRHIYSNAGAAMGAQEGTIAILRRRLADTQDDAGA